MLIAESSLQTDPFSFLVHQLLYDEVMLKTADSVSWNPKLLATLGTRCSVTRQPAPVDALKTSEAEPVETRQRLRVVADAETDRTQCEVGCC